MSNNTQPTSDKIVVSLGGTRKYLDELVEKTTARNYTGVMRDALRTYLTLVKGHEKGYEFFMKNTKTGEIIPAPLFVDEDKPE